MQSRAPFLFIILTVALDAIGIGLILPVMPELISELRGASISDAAFWGGWLSFTYAFMQFLCGPALGNLSDRVGRRPVLIVTLTFLGLGYVMMALATSLLALFVARFLAGITGATHATAAAYLADISSRDKRAANFGLIGAAFGVGFILGPAIGGLLGEVGPRAPFIAAAAVSFANAAFGYFVLPESLKPENRRAFEWRRANPLRAIMAMKRLPQMGGLLGANFLSVVSNYVYPAIWSFFIIERFGWSSGMVGLSLAAFGVSSAVVQGWLIRRLLPRLGEWRTAVFGLSMHVLSLLGVAFVPDGVVLFALMPVAALGAMAGPAVQGMMANRVSDDTQGELQGVLAAVAGIGVIISPVLMTGVFRVFTADTAPVYAPGAPFVVAALLAAGALVLLVRGRRVAPA
ncbi:TCR/Tet family MFS transporter [Oceanibium sediminis]|uniref:TCR/Tet family MFS transporter n=1 Tax=Oceanibium sediminis TaxID=2026339 RepID=UPI000DD303BE|nr:TCR/Tet family MFS transporter [Oceanibium sediminis]